MDMRYPEAQDWWYAWYAWALTITFFNHQIQEYDQQVLVGGFDHLEKYESMGRIIPYIMEYKKCSKPATRVNWKGNFTSDM